MILYSLNVKRKLYFTVVVISVLTSLACLAGNIPMYIPVVIIGVLGVFVHRYIKTSKAKNWWLALSNSKIEWGENESVIHSICLGDIRSICLVDNDELLIRVNKQDGTEIFIPNHSYSNKAFQDVERDFKSLNYYVYSVPY